MRRRAEQRPERASPGARELYRDFWEGVGSTFPDLGGAASTASYRRDEQRLFRDYLPDLDGLRLLKTDLWDEAVNTRILTWAAGLGCRVHGIDLSAPTAVRARSGFEQAGRRLAAVVADVRAIPYADGSLDAVYSMGTVEHFAETELAVAEIFRVLRSEGRAIIGVPYRWDPFLRPLLVAILRSLGLYAYGFEKSYSRRSLRALCQGAGFRVVAETGILFIPGWLRMLDLALHTWCRPLDRLTAPAVRFFAWVSRRFPRVRRHGYLIAAVVERPTAR